MIVRVCCPLPVRGAGNITSLGGTVPADIKSLAQRCWLTGLLPAQLRMLQATL